MEAPSSQPQIRYRVNVARTTKGAYSWDCTAEVVMPITTDGALQAEYRSAALEESAALVDALNAKYPVEKGV